MENEPKKKPGRPKGSIKRKKSVNSVNFDGIDNKTTNFAKKRQLTKLQRKFIDYYLVDQKASEAVIKAGYDTKNPDVIGYQLLSNPLISQFLTERKRQIRKLEDDKILLELSSRAKLQKLRDNIANFDTAVMFDDNGNIKPIDQIPVDSRLAIQSIEVKESTTIRQGETTTASCIKKIQIASKLVAIKDLDDFWAQREEWERADSRSDNDVVDVLKEIAAKLPV
jgi:phage terminase small subunit